MAKFSEKVSILGTEYRILVKPASALEKNVGGFCDPDLREIHVLDLSTDADWDKETARKKDLREKHFLRHEIVHAFFNESGLKANTLWVDASWAQNEEMVDWLATQGPKIYAAWKETGCL